MLRSTGTGIERAAIFENFEERAKVLGRYPGTHSLGKEFETPKKEK
jgi:hypothetical protein